MKSRILLVNPPIYDFSAHDFWLKPFGLLRVAGLWRGQADMRLFDYLDRLHPLMPRLREQRPGEWSRGKFYAEPAPERAAAGGGPGILGGLRPPGNGRPEAGRWVPIPLHLLLGAARISRLRGPSSGRSALRA